jgi:hypothetical protein
MMMMGGMTGRCMLARRGAGHLGGQLVGMNY